MTNENKYSFDPVWENNPGKLHTGFISGTTFQNRTIVYEEVDGWAVFEGCILLGKHADVRLTSDSIRKSEAPTNSILGSGIVGGKYRWPDRCLVYTIDDNLPDKYRVHEAIAHWKDKTHMAFLERTPDNANSFPDYVMISPGCGCQAAVGRQGGKQFIHLSDRCTTGNMIHEIGHAFGLWHEHSRADRDKYVQINWHNIEEKYLHNFWQHITDGDDIGPYDYGSIMHYPTHAFTKNNKPTIVPCGNNSIGQMDGLSPGDVAAIHTMYGVALDSGRPIEEKYPLWEYNRLTGRWEHVVPP